MVADREVRFIFSYNFSPFFFQKKQLINLCIPIYNVLKHSITIKSALIGYLETGGVNGFYSKFRDGFFRTMGVIGVAKKVLLDAATPKL